MTTQRQVLIIGAGPTGLTLATDLARRGIDCQVLERASELPTQSRGKGLQPRSLEVLDDLGVIDDILHHGEWRQRITLFKDRRKLAELPAGTASSRPDLPYPNIVMIPQWRITEILLRRLRELGGEVRFGCRLDDLAIVDEAEGGGVHAVVTNQSGGREEIQARYVVGCDGGHSTVRRRLDIPLDGESRESNRYLLGDVVVKGWRHSDGHHVRSYAWFGSDGSFLGLAGLPSTRSWQIGMSVPGDGPWEPSLETFQALWNERTGHTDVTLTEPTWLSDFQVNVRMVRTYRKGPVLLAGDAAHVHPPTGGQGMNTGIQDAYNLGWKLALRLRGLGGDDLLDSYEAERLPVARAVLAKSTDILDVVMSKNPVVAALVQRVLLPILSVHSINQALTSRVSQIDVGYRDSPLTHDKASSGRLRPGDRAPDAVGTDTATGKLVRLFDVFRGPHATLLLLTADAIGSLPTDLPDELHRCLVTKGASPESWSGRTLRDHDKTIQHAYRGTPGTILLVRPDGYIAAIAPASDVTALRRYLHDWYVS